ncbi:MAG: excinuclease ABC subunit UvrA [Bacteroides sp.]|nr:excinuclease ABC subunit UvrA [Prevotella sp.]MCM1407832.1 excinuclease ABC subunit UvrA [Treponema brennaborense]MCM1470885.1 excinuclease ABC subunit UvrA [Bacteroides sp.]
MPDKIEIRGARVHNLKNIDADIPLGKIVAVAGVSGSGKSSLALGVLYSEGSRRYLESLSAYTRRRMTQEAEAKLDSIENVPAAIALHQRPAVPSIRSTFGTATELLNPIRLMFSRLGSYRCPNGHYLPPSVNVAADKNLVCPECGEVFGGASAESFSFNSTGACRHCGGTGVVRTVNEASLVPDESKTIDEGAVAPWQTLMWSLMKDIARAMGVRTDVPFCELTQKERDIVFHGPAVKKNIIYQNKTSGAAGDMDFTYFNATYTVENALSKVKDEKGMKRVEKFLTQGICPECGGARLNKTALSTLLCGKNSAEVCAMTLDELIVWVSEVPKKMPRELFDMAQSIANQFLHTAKRLIDLGLGYLTLDRAGSTLSTGELQRTQLARAVRNRTTGVLYVLDEPSIGLHPVNVDGLIAVMRDLKERGNSVVVVDHDVRVIKAADYVIEMGKGAGQNGGSVIAQGTAAQIAADKNSIIGKYLNESAKVQARERAQKKSMFENGHIKMQTLPIYSVGELDLDLPKGRLIAVTGVSGAGKTTMILEGLVPALQAKISSTKLPAHVKSVSADNIDRVNLIDATPIGINVRSTVATYSGVLDDLRKIFAATDDAKSAGLKAADFSYNTGSLRCPDCDGTGVIDMDVQFLPDVEITCPACGGSRYGKAAGAIQYKCGNGESFMLPQIMAMTVNEAKEKLQSVSKLQDKLQTLCGLGLGYLTLGESTPALSGGEAQRLKLASEMGKSQENSVFVFDEPTIGLHPDDVKTLIELFDSLVKSGATVIVIEHDLDLIANADYIVDMGISARHGKIVASGTPKEIAGNKESVTGRYL